MNDIIQQFSDRARHLFQKGWFVVLLLLGVTILTFSNALHNPFLMDDHTFFFSDMKMPNKGMIWEYFVPDMRKHLGMDKLERGASYYRPLAHVLPSLCYMVFKDDTFKHHCFNLLLFVLLCFTLYRAVLLVTRDVFIAVVTSLLFCVHPINGLMVNYITAQVFSLQLILMLLCAMLFVKSEVRFLDWQNSVAILCFALSLLCHETAMAMPFYLTLLWLFILRPKKVQWQVLLPFIFVLLGYAFFRLYFASLKVSVIDKYHKFNMNGFEYVATFMHVIGWYLSKLFFLKGIVLIWVTQPVKSGLLRHLVLLAVSGVGLFYIMKYFYRHNKNVLAAMMWVMIGFIPVLFACLFKPKHGMMFEPHWMFFASIGFFVALAYFINDIPRRYVLIVVLLMLLVMMGVSRSYNALWSNEKQYCLNWLKEVQDYPGAVFLLADVYAREGNFIEAKKLYEQYGNDWGVLNNLGLLALRQGHTQEAKQYFLQALKDNPNAALAYTNLAGIELDAGHFNEAEGYLQQSIVLNHYLLASRKLLMKVYVMQHKFTEAEALCGDTLSIFPNDDGTVFLSIMLDLQLGRQGTARENAAALAQRTQDTKVLNDLSALANQYRFTDVALALKLRKRGQ